MSDIKNIIIYFPSLAEVEGEIYSYERSYERHKDFISHFSQDTQFYLMRERERHLGAHMFIPNYIWSGDEWIKNIEEIYGHLILGPHRDITWTNIFHNQIQDFCKDKTLIEGLFPHYTLKSLRCESYNDIQSNFYRVPSTLKVLKPLQGSGGHGIIFSHEIPRSEAIIGKYPYLLQEFFDTSEGFHGYSGIHDFRTILIDGVISGAFLRIASTGLYTANVSLGAEIIDFGVENIPEEVIHIIREVDDSLKTLFPQRYYSLDIGKGNDGSYKIFELNANPMLSTPSIRKHLAEYIQETYLKDTTFSL